MCKFITLLIFVQLAINVLSASASDETQTTEDECTIDNESGELGKQLGLIPLTDAINDFGMKFIQELNSATNDKPSENIAFSPLSISLIFSMIIPGAQSGTLDELMNVFGFADQLKTPDDVSDAFKLLLDNYEKTKLQESKRAIKLLLSNLALYSTELNVKESFRKNLKDNYKANVSEIDFADPNAINVINDFVDKNTNGLIPKLIENLDRDTQLLLVNAFYFKGDWIKAFDEKMVENRTFNNVDNTVSQVQIMSKEDEFNYFEDNDVQTILLPYSGNASLTILLPKKDQSVSDLMKNLTNSLIDYYRNQMTMRTVQLFLPKFKIERFVNLKEPLENMGVVKIFKPEAELGGISRDIFVSKAIHKSVLDVNEQGTQAAASTAVSITNSLPKQMVIDRPFVFLIHDTLNNLILFMGSVKKL